MLGCGQAVIFTYLLVGMSIYLSSIDAQNLDTGINRLVVCLLFSPETAHQDKLELSPFYHSGKVLIVFNCYRMQNKRIKKQQQQKTDKTGILCTAVV